MVVSNIGDKHPQKVLMYGDKYLNILYSRTLDAMKIPGSCIQHIKETIHCIMHSKQAMALGKFDLLVTFGDHANFCTETPHL